MCCKWHEEAKAARAILVTRRGLYGNASLSAANETTDRKGLLRSGPILDKGLLQCNLHLGGDGALCVCTFRALCTFLMPYRRWGQCCCLVPRIMEVLPLEGADLAANGCRSADRICTPNVLTGTPNLAPALIPLHVSTPILGGSGAAPPTELLPNMCLAVTVWLSIEVMALHVESRVSRCLETLKVV